MAWFKKAEKSSAAERPLALDIQSGSVGNAKRADGSGDMQTLTGPSLRRPMLHLGDVVSVLMASEHHRSMNLADLQAIVVPSLLAGQYAIATTKGKAEAAGLPVAIVLWANVSVEIDQKLEKGPQAILQLKRKDWRDGKQPWVLVTAGPKGVVQNILRKLSADVWSSTPAKIHSRNAEGKTSVSSVIFRRTNETAPQPHATTH